MNETIILPDAAAAADDELAIDEIPLGSTQLQFRTTLNGEYLGQTVNSHRQHTATMSPPLDLVSLPNTQKDIVVNESILIEGIGFNFFRC